MIIIYSVNYDNHEFKCHDMLNDSNEESKILKITAEKFVSYEQGEKNIVYATDINHIDHIKQGYFIHKVDDYKYDIYYKEKTPIAGWTGLNFECKVKKILYFASYELDTVPVVDVVPSTSTKKAIIPLQKNKFYDEVIVQLKKEFEKKNL